jgi:hypothetical protein
MTLGVNSLTSTGDINGVGRACTATPPSGRRTGHKQHLKRGRIELLKAGVAASNPAGAQPEGPAREGFPPGPPFVVLRVGTRVSLGPASLAGRPFLTSPDHDSKPVGSGAAAPISTPLCRPSLPSTSHVPQPAGQLVLCPLACHLDYVMTESQPRILNGQSRRFQQEDTR